MAQEIEMEFGTFKMRYENQIDTADSILVLF
jgi:hypothetical protein